MSFYVLERNVCHGRIQFIADCCLAEEDER